MNKKKIAVVGIGVGVSHLEALEKLKTEFPIEISGVGRATHGELSPRAKKAIGNAPIYVGNKMYDLLDTSDILLIATPDKDHYDPAFLSIDWALHTLIEKPAFIERQQGLDLIRLAEENGVLLDSATQMRMHSQGLANLINQYKPESISLTYLLPKTKLNMPDVLPNILPHILSLIPDLNGVEVRDIYQDKDQVNLQLLKKGLCIFAKLGYVPEQMKPERSVTLHTNTGTLERVFSQGSLGGQYQENWFSVEPVINPREALWRNWLQNIFSEDFPELRQECLKYREQRRERIMQEHLLLMQAMGK